MYSLLERLWIILLFFLLPLFLFGQKDYWAVVRTNCADFGAARELRQQMVAEGHLVSLIYRPDFFMARLQASPAAVSAQFPAITAVSTDPAELKGSDAPPTLAAFFSKLKGNGFSGQLKSKERGSAAFEDFESCAHASDAPIEKSGNQDFALVNDYNSEFFKGIVTTSVLFIESDGTEDPNYYSWTRARLEEEKLDVLMALNTWAYTAFLAGADLTFIPDWIDQTTYTNQGLEPNLHLGSFEFYGYELGKMTGSVLKNLGYRDDYVRAQGDNFGFDRRTRYQSDFAFTIGVHYSHNGKGYIRANAMIGGPITYLSPEYGFQVYGHEIGHIFHAWDEYLNTSNCNGGGALFNGVPNNNNMANSCPEKQPCVMNDNAVQGQGEEVHFAVCTYTKSHFGWDQALPPAPILRSELSQVTSPVFQLEAEFPAYQYREVLNGYLKIWQVKEDRDSLIISDDLGPVSGLETWISPRALFSGDYKAVFYHGRKGQYALAPSQTLEFTVDFNPVFSFRDTCFYFCQAPGPVLFEQSNLRWYGDRALTQLISENSEFVPPFNSDSTVYLAHYNGEVLDDLVQVRFVFGRPGSVGLQSKIDSEGRTSLSLYSFLPLFAREVKWYRNGEEIPGENEWTLFVEGTGSYNAVLDNGCLIYSDTLSLIDPPALEIQTNCDQLGYRLVATGQNLQWYNDRMFPFSTEDTLTLTNVTFYRYLYVSQTVDGVESPKVEIILVPYEEEFLEVRESNGYLQVKTASETVNWWLNDTLLLADGPNSFTAPRTGIYQASTLNFQGCATYSKPLEIVVQTPPPVTEFYFYEYCVLKGREDEGEVDENLPLVHVDGENIRWYYDATLGKVFYTGNDYQTQASDFFGYATFFVTQTINGLESPPIAIRTATILPMDVFIDSLGTLLHAVPNGENATLPDQYLFQWYRNDSPIPEGNSEWLETAGNGGWYSVSIENLAGNCLKSEPVFLEFPTSTNEPAPLEPVLGVYPNPTQGLFYLQFDKSGEKMVQLFHTNGALLRQLRSSDELIEINVTGLPAGMYIVRCLLENGGMVSRKVVLQE